MTWRLDAVIPLWVLALVALFLTYLIFQRWGKPVRSLFFVYAYAVTFVGLVVAEAVGSFIYSTSRDVYIAMAESKSYEAKVVDYKYTHTEKGDYRERERTYYEPIVQFTTASGKQVETKLDFEVDQYNKDKQYYTIHYNKQTGQVVTFGFPLYMKCFGLLLGVFVFLLPLMWAVWYVSGADTKWITNVIIAVVFYFFVPALMLGLAIVFAYYAMYGTMIWSGGSPKEITSGLRIGLWALAIFLGLSALAGYPRALIDAHKRDDKKAEKVKGK